uniref:AA_TRNA_LIGASE_II domain-containing protein n=1 Tax=Caenorhabditis japonica TaxID=281687 RepID=A0A8R1HYF3_CAEJA
MTLLVAPRILRGTRRFSSEKLQGWANSVQKSGQNVFIKLDDGRDGEPVQIVADKAIGKEVKFGCAITASGSVQKSKGAQQETEFVAEQLAVVASDSNKHDFIHIDTPKLTRNDCEGGGEVFDVVTPSEDPMYLTVSSQLHLEAMVSRLRKVYTLGPAFRAEKQQSHAHLSEFHMLEAEVAFVDTIEEMCSFVELYVRHIACSIQDTKINEFPTSKFPRISYDDAVALLLQKGEKVTAKSGFSKKNELDLVKLHENQPLFVTHYPASQKPFYMARTSSEGSEEKTLSFDLLVPGVGELAGGSIREKNPEVLASRGCEIEWYLEMRRRGQPPSGGFGIGFERLLQYLLGIQNIKDTVAFPRWYRHCQC